MAFDGTPDQTVQHPAHPKGLSQRGIVRGDYIAWLRHRQSKEHAGYYGVMLWVLVMLEQWLAAHGH